MTLLLLLPTSELNLQFRTLRWTTIRRETPHVWHGRLARASDISTNVAPLPLDTASYTRFDKIDEDPERWDGLS